MIGPYKLRLRRKIPDDLLEIHAYLAEHATLSIAGRFLKAFRTTTEKIALHPVQGSSKANLGEPFAEVRTWRVEGFPNHLILYRVMADMVIVFTVTHGARNLRHLLDKRI